MECFEVTQRVLAKAPDNPRALTYQGVIRTAMGQGDRALALFDRALDGDPALVEAWMHRGITTFQMERYDEAVRSWEKATALAPASARGLAAYLDEARWRAAGNPPRPLPGIDDGAPAGAGSQPAHPESRPASVADAPPSAGDAGGAAGVGGVIEIDPSVTAAVPAGSVLFVIARPAGATGGPPVAVKRIAAPTFPLRFELGPADAMMGQPFPSRIALEARIDRDGVATTRDPADPKGRQDDVAAGASAVKLVLRVGP
jgi:hypothetical protein